MNYYPSGQPIHAETEGDEPDFYDLACERADMDRKRAKEDRLMTILASDCKRCGGPLDEGFCSRCAWVIDLREYEPEEPR